MKLLLSNRTTYPFTQENGICFCGYFIYNGHKYTAEAAITHIRDRLSHISFEELLHEINYGLYSFVVETDSKVFCAVDRIRSFQFYYATENNELILSDSAHSVFDALSTVTADETSFDELKLSGIFISGPHTLCNEIRSLQSGEYFVYDKASGTIETHFYYKIGGDGTYHDWTDEEYLDRFSEVFDKACENLRIALAGRTAAVALSGGLDSREILLMLKRIKHEKVVCFTFGTKGHLDTELPKKIAEEYGYQWHFVEYLPSTWKKLRKDPDFVEYITTRHNMCTVTEIQEYAAVKQLTENEILPNDSVIITGNTGTIIAGKLDRKFVDEQVNYQELLDFVKIRYYNRTDIPERLNERFESYFDKTRANNSAESAAQFLNFNIMERQFKFCLSSQAMFASLGYEALLPVCDTNFLDFAKKVPLRLRMGKKLLRDFVSRHESIGCPPSSSAVYARVGGAIRSTTLLRKIVRKASKLTKYFRSLNRIENIFPFFKYAKHALKGSEFFTINHIFAYDMMKDTRKRISEKQKASAKATISM